MDIRASTAQNINLRVMFAKISVQTKDTNNGLDGRWQRECCLVANGKDNATQHPDICSINFNSEDSENQTAKTMPPGIVATRTMPHSPWEAKSMSYDGTLART